MQCQQNLLCQSFLNLRALGKELHDAVNFRQPDNGVFRDIGNGGFTVDSDKVVFTGAGQRDITDRHHLIHFHFIFNQGDFREIVIIQS